MVRGRGKGKKHPLVAARDDTGCGEDEKLPARRRGRPMKLLKNDIEEDDKVQKIKEDEDGEDTKSSMLNKSNKNQPAIENGRKRKRPSEVKENVVLGKSGEAKTSSPDVIIKSVGYRQNGSRRKNKPSRAAEVGVECI